MHLAIPALESLHRGWETQVNKLARVKFEPTAGMNKIAEYYDKVTDSDAYIFCMRMFTCSISSLRRRPPGVTLVLDPSRKLPYWGKHWSAELQPKSLYITVEKIVCNIYPEC
jgi:hypothetical protein